jgi:Arc/MetJ family transcription regulator
MRTTINIDDDLLAAAKALARLEKTSTGQTVSRLLREILAVARAADAGRHEAQPRRATGFRPFSGHGKAVTNEQVNALRAGAGV